MLRNSFSSMLCAFEMLGLVDMYWIYAMMPSGEDSAIVNWDSVG